MADFATATGTPYQPGDPAPTTFPIVVAFAAMQGLMADPEVGVESTTSSTASRSSSPSVRSRWATG